MSYEYNDLIRAVDMIASISPRVLRNIWDDTGINLDYLRGYKYKCEDNTFSGSENAAYEFAISLWNGEAKIRLDDILLFDDQNYVKVLKALMILRRIQKIEVQPSDRRLKGKVPSWMAPASERPAPRERDKPKDALAYHEELLKECGEDMDYDSRERLMENIKALRAEARAVENPF